MNELDAIWIRLINYRLNCAQNPSIVENHLPFGMRRQLKPLRFSRQLLDMKRSALLSNKFTIELKDPWMALNHRKPLILKAKPLADPNTPNSNKIKFIPHKIVSSCSSCLIDDTSTSVKFDPTALLFYKDGIASSTNITSNANGTVSCDKNHLGAILKQGCWLVSLPDLLSFPCSNLPQTMNNKLRGIKFAEFLSQEWNNLEGFGEEVEFVAINHCEGNTMKMEILMSKRRNVNGMSLFIINSEGQVKNQLTSKIGDGSNLIYKEDVSVEVGDIIVLIKSKGSEEDVINVIEIICKTSFCIEDDMESKMISRLRGFKGISCLLISKVHFSNDFDLAFSKEGSSAIKYKCHLDTKIGMIVNEPIPGPFGCTTRHSVIFREGYFASLHHDASKINRFPDTINYIIRKLCNPNNLGRRLEQEGDDNALKRISDIQYFAYVINWKDKIILGLGGGAKCILLGNQTNYVEVLNIYEMPILIDISSDLRRNTYDNYDVDEDVVMGNTVNDVNSSSWHLILLSPHFPTFLIKSIKGSCSIKEFMNELLKLGGVDTKSFKVSMAHFQISKRQM